MPFTNSSSYLFVRDSITKNAPHASGVYGLFSSAWVYIGESEDIQKRLLEHLNGDNPCINRFAPTNFTYELSAAAMRVARQDQLIAEFHPSCNQRPG
jgi:hypothetical protein